MSDAVKEFLDVLNDRLLKKPKPFDRQGVVKRVEGKTAYVRFNGSNIETPVQLTIDCKPGDTVQTRVARKNAWLVGNLTAPPTDDKLAAKAHMQAKLAYNKAVKAGEKVDEVDEKVMLVDEKAIEALVSANGKSVIYHSAEEPTGGEYQEGDTWFDTDDDNKIYKWSGSAWSPVLLGDDAIDSISANKITAGEIDASQITVSNLDAGNITSGTLDTNRINVTDLIQVGNIATDSDIPTEVSDLDNDSGFVTADGIVMRNLVKNGYWDADFKSDVTGWTKESSAVLNYDASTDLYAISCSSSYYGLTQTISVEANTDYVISASVGSNFHLGFGAPSYPKDSGTWSTASDGRKYKVVNSGSRTSMAVYAYAEADTCYINRIKVEKGSTYTGWYDDNAKDLSSKYLTTISGMSGICVHAANDTSNYGNFNSNGMTIYKGGVDVASFGAEQRIGASTGSYFKITSSDIRYYQGGGSYCRFRLTGDNNGACTIANGLSTGYPSELYLAPDYFSISAYDRYTNAYKKGIEYDANDGNLSIEGTISAAHSGVIDISSSVTSVTTGTLVSTTVVTFGKVASLHICFKNTSSVAAGSNVFAATLASAYRPALDWATGGGYYGSSALQLAISSSGAITVRNAASAAVTCSANTNVTATYILA